IRWVRNRFHKVMYLCSAISISCCFLSLGKDRESEKAELGVIAETLTTDMENLDEMAVFCAFGNKKRTKVPNKEDC
ncbi:MAG: hypothetical protein IJZ38_10370, partial [Bacteroides sp.]|nr:hypothetical protein [Bacteroides sp.]